MPDRRIARTRTALVGAFNHLFLHRRQRHIRVADIVAEAGVGRSTFYEHYSSADEILLQAMRAPIAALADAGAGKGDVARVTWLLDHFWENRRRARDLMRGPMNARIARLLAGMIAERLEMVPAIPIPLATAQLSEAMLAPIRGWVMAEAPCAPDALATAICRCGAAMVASLTAPEEAE